MKESVVPNIIVITGAYPDIGEKVRDAEFLLRKDGLLVNVEG